MELIGQIKKIGDVQTFGSGFQKREFVILTEETYPQSIAIEINSNRIDLLDPFKVGDRAKVGINIQGKEWVSPNGETKYFNTIVAWKILQAN